ncbi:MAG: type II secretion system F family protein [Phycisphaeraceae bacterium]|nr:type II secretion system F family protein [Phycisphaeraceae bacterium]MCW5753338.1 type II secretion system F family protein [Phycisphaeraceae bacterium]
MATFRYTALRLTGERVVGELAGASEQAVIAELESRQLTPVSVEARKTGSRRKRGVSARKLGTSYKQIADLLRAGVPLLRALKLLANRRTSPRLAEAFRELAEAVEQGEDMADAMAERPELFSRVHVAMVRAGEKGGFLEDVLDRLGQLVLAQAELRSKIIGNLIYPTVLVAFGGVVLWAIFAFFVPRVAGLFQQIPGELPALTKIVLGVSAAVGSYGLITIAVVVALILGVWRLARRAEVKHALAVFRTRVPVLGPLTRSLAASRFCRMLGTLLGNNVPMLASLDIARQAAGNILLEEAIAKATESVRGGETLAPHLAESGLFSDDVIEMILVGESANNLDEVLVSIADTIDHQIERLLSGVVRLIEPVLLLLIACVVVVVAMGLILPMVKLSSAA